MTGLPARGPAVRELGLALPPARMAPLRGGRPLKRWRYVGVYMPGLMLCVGEAHIGPVPQRWWAVALPDGTLRERTTVRHAGVRLRGDEVRVRAPGVEIDLELFPGEAVEVASPAAAGGYAWTAKRAPVRVRGRVVLDGHARRVHGDHAFIDDSAGYHDRHTAWKWSAGIGRTEAGARVAWNAVAGIHDDPRASERTLWIEGDPRELGPVRFAGDLGGLEFAEGGALTFTEWSSREENTNLGLLRSRYRQPFGTFAGTLPGGLALTEGFGVMEDHDVHW